MYSTGCVRGYGEVEKECRISDPFRTMKKKLLRDVTKKECPWLDEDLKKGMTVYIYHGYTYGCVQPTGIAVTKKQEETPFFEVPRDAIDKDDPMIRYKLN